VTKATLHDELMHEAGFETDYYAEIARRREQRHRKLKVDLLRAVRVAAVIGVLFGAVAPIVEIVSGSNVVLRAPYPVVLLPFLVGVAAEFLLHRMGGKGDPRDVIWRLLVRCGRSVVRAGKRAAHGWESRA
jgi:hypothetical protein